MRVSLTNAYFVLRKVAALDGNSKFEFGLQWSAIIRGLADSASEPEKLIADLEAGVFRAKFMELDADGSGEFGAEELFALLRANGAADVTTGVVANLIRLADDGGSGSISYEEFENVLHRIGGVDPTGQIRK